jgi:hypothetical protein
MLRHVFAAVFIAVLSLGKIQAQGPAYYASTQASLLPLLQVLDNAGISASLEFSGSCNSFVGTEFPEFPRFNAVATNGATPLETVRQMFAENPTVRVTQDADGTIRIVQRDTPLDFLNVKVTRISFETGRPSALRPIYSGNAALFHVLSASEVNRFMEDHNIQKLGFTAIGPLPPSTPPSNTPYLSPRPLENVTVSEAMDYIVKAFPGIWIYQNCPKRGDKKRYVYLAFYHLQKTGVGMIVQ